MKRIILMAVLALSQLFSTAQIIIHGRVIDQHTNLPLPGATVSIDNQNVITSIQGEFSFRISSLNKKEIIVTNVNYNSLKKDLKEYEAAILDKMLVIGLSRKDLFLQPVEVLATRSANNAPFTKSNLYKKEIQKNNTGQDLPFVLNQLPSVIVSSDAGNGVGYTGMRIRGSDLSRINVTLNGIPYNDAESQGVFFVDLPDFVSSVNSIQVQRGVGTSSNGAGAFGATINISTNEFNEIPYAEINNSYGSFNTWKNTVKAGTGLINDHFTLDARLSRIVSDGYIDRASSDLKAYYLTGAYINGSSQIRMNVFGGTEKTYQAWNGVPESLLITNRRFNSAGIEKPGDPYENETDNYRQDHYQFLLNHSFNSKFSSSIALFYTRGKGYYEQYKAEQYYADYGLANPVIGGDTLEQTDLIRQLWLDNHFYGMVFSFQYKNKGTNLTLGGGANQYDGSHYGKVIWSAVGFPKDHQWYENEAEKKDFNLYSKLQRTIGTNWELFADLQFRNVIYDLDGFRNNPSLVIKNKYRFLNPKIGISYAGNGLRTYLSYARANKEPNRDDFEAGLTQQPRPESLHDIELGIEKRMKFFSWGATAYYMRYSDQLVLTGKINDVGAYTRTNIPNSYRLGLELEGSIQPIEQFRWNLNLSLSENKILDFEEFIDDYDNGGQKINKYSKPDISFSPSVIAASGMSWFPAPNLEATLRSKYVGMQFLDNTSNDARSLNAYFVNDFQLIWTMKLKKVSEVTIAAQFNNFMDEKYEPNGYTFSYWYGGELTTENFYFPMAGRSFVLTLNVRL